MFTPPEPYIDKDGSLVAYAGTSEGGIIERNGIPVIYANRVPGGWELRDADTNARIFSPDDPYAPDIPLL